MVNVWCPQCAELHTVKKREQGEPLPIVSYDTECGIMIFLDDGEVLNNLEEKAN